jgi:hypothetical protein
MIAQTFFASETFSNAAFELLRVHEVVFSFFYLRLSALPVVPVQRYLPQHKHFLPDGTRHIRRI